MKSIRLAIMVLGAAAILWPCIAISQVAAIAAPTNRWDATLGAGITLTSGNSDTMLSTLTFKAVRKTTNSEVLLGAAGTYGEATTETTRRNGDKHDDTRKTAANVSAFGQYNHLFTDRFYGGGRVDFVHDDIADLKYRVTASPLVGYYAIKNPKTKLGFEFGPSGVFEQQGDDDNQYVALRLGDRFEYKFTPKSRVWQAFDYMPQVDKFSNYLLVTEVGAEASLTDKVFLRAVVQDTYDNEPADGRKQNDLKLIASVVYRF